MAENKNSFVLYLDQKETFEALTDEQSGKLIKHIFNYVSDENPTTDDVIVNAVFIGIKQTLKRDLKRWEAKQAQRSNAGKKSAEIRKKAAKLLNEKNTNPTNVNDRQHPSTVSGSVSVSVSGSVSESVLSKMESGKNARAIDFLKSNKQIEFEDFEMQNRKYVENWNMLLESFNDTIDIEISQNKIQWETDQLMPRLRKFTRAWIGNELKSKKTNNQDISNRPKYL